MLLSLTVNDTEAMQALGEKIAVVLSDKDVLYLVGELGAGKTTLAQGIVKGLGYRGIVSSPTFTLMKVYPGDIPVYHFDFYRLEGSELDDLGLEDYLEKEGIALIEWPEIGAGVLPTEALIIEIHLNQGDYDRERRVLIKAEGTRYRDKLKELKDIVDPGN